MYDVFILRQDSSKRGVTKKLYNYLVSFIVAPYAFMINIDTMCV